MENMNKWMEFSNEYAQLMNDNFQVMNKFWNATVDQSSGHTRASMEMFFDHMNRNVEIMHDIFNTATKSDKELQKIFKTNIEKFNDRYQKVYREAVETVAAKTMNAEK